MKIYRQQPTQPFIPFTITIESLDELICLRAIIDAARRGERIETTMRTHWNRSEQSGSPQPGDAEIFAMHLRDALPLDERTAKR
jgi:hypothetical protein